MTQKTKPFSIRLTEAEHDDLKRRAGRRAIGDYVRAVLFDGSTVQRQQKAVSRPNTPIHDDIAIAKVLALLGKSEVAQSLRTLAEAAKLGAVPVLPDTEAALRTARHHVAEIKSLLMKALRIKEG